MNWINPLSYLLLYPATVTIDHVVSMIRQENTIETEFSAFGKQTVVNKHGEIS